MSRCGLNEPTSTRSQASRSSMNSASTGDRAVGLEVDVEARPRELVEELGQRRHLLAAADQRLAHLVEREIRDRALEVGDPVEHGVVEGQQHAVLGHVHVGLEVVVAERDRVLERRQGVLEPLDLRVVGATPVGESEHAARVAGHFVEVGEPGHRRRHASSMYPDHPAACA